MAASMQRGLKHITISLIPRPFLPPVIDHLQYHIASTGRRKRLGTRLHNHQLPFLTTASMEEDTICFTVSAALCRSMTLLCILIS